jgi:uncharacterized protein
MNDTSSEMFSTRGARIGLVWVLGTLALFLLVQTFGELSNLGRAGSPATDTITVQGNGEAMLAPDVAHISFTIQNRADTVADAQEQTVKEIDAALAFIEKQDIEKKDIKTLSYNISPEYSYPNPCGYGMPCPYSGTPKIVGYNVSETVQVTVRDLVRVGAILGGLGELGVENVNGPSFALDDATAGYTAARENAIEKAVAQAELLEDQLGIKLGKIVNFSESMGGYYPMYAKYDMRMGGAMETNASSAPSIQPGENTYSASVSITYEIR